MRFDRPLTAPRRSPLTGFDLPELGWSAALAEQLEPGLEPGRVVTVHRGAFDVGTAEGSSAAAFPAASSSTAPSRGRRLGRARGRRRRRGTAAAERARAQRGGPRDDARRHSSRTSTSRSSSPRSARARPAAHRALPRLALGERRAPEIVLTKADRLDDLWLPSPRSRRSPGVPVHVVSAVTGQGCDALRARIEPGMTAVCSARPASASPRSSTTSSAAS